MDNIEENYVDETALFELIQKFLIDLTESFPEFEENLKTQYCSLFENQYKGEFCVKLLKHVKHIFPQHFFDILY